jgi:hypothetical protein
MPLPNFGGAFGPPQNPAGDSTPKEPCEVCSQPTKVGADIRYGGQDWQRHPVCKVEDNPFCLEQLMENYQGRSQMQSCYPSKQDI